MSSSFLEIVLRSMAPGDRFVVSDVVGEAIRDRSMGTTTLAVGRRR
jgi:hypothetical protein